VVVVMKGEWCPVCRAQLQRLSQLEPRLAELDAKLIALNADSPEANRRMRDALGIGCTVLSDAKQRVLSWLGLWQPRLQQPLPALLVFDRCGAEAARWVGRGPGDRPEAALLEVLRKLSEEKRACARPSV
jgi:peroxiredoxin